MVVALVVGQLIAWCYVWTHSGVSYSRNFTQALILLCLIIAMVMSVVGTNLVVAFGLLVCKPELIPYYSRLGWQEFDGTLVVRQHGTPAEFTYNRVMVCEIQTPAPAGGAIDLQGPPW